MQPIDRTIACVSAKTVYGVVAVAVLHIPGCGEKKKKTDDDGPPPVEFGDFLR